MLPTEVTVVLLRILLNHYLKIARKHESVSDNISMNCYDLMWNAVCQFYKIIQISLNSFYQTLEDKEQKTWSTGYICWFFNVYIYLYSCKTKYNGTESLRGLQMYYVTVHWHMPSSPFILRNNKDVQNKAINQLIICIIPRNLGLFPTSIENTHKTCFIPNHSTNQYILTCKTVQE